MIKKETGVYKGLCSKGVVRAFRLLATEFGNMLAGENDFIRDPAIPIKGQMKRYCNTYNFENGWSVFKALIPDISRNNGDGYHSVAVVASSAESVEGINEALRYAAQVKPLNETAGAVITQRSVVVLTGNMEFTEARARRRSDYSGYTQVFVYSVKNALGVVKNVLGLFAKFYSIRATALKEKYNKLPLKLRMLLWRLNKRAGLLFERVRNYENRLVDLKSVKRKLAAYFAYVKKMHKLVPHTWIPPEIQYLDDGIAQARELFNLSADNQGIDVFGIEMAQADNKLKELKRLQIESNLRRKAAKSKSTVPT